MNEKQATKSFQKAAICQLNMYHGNPRDGCYFHQENNDQKNESKERPRWAPAKAFVLVVALKGAALTFEWLQRKAIFKLLKLVCKGSEASLQVTPRERQGC